MEIFSLRIKRIYNINQDIITREKIFVSQLVFKSSFWWKQKLRRIFFHIQNCHCLYYLYLHYMSFCFRWIFLTVFSEYSFNESFWKVNLNFGFFQLDLLLSPQSTRTSERYQFDMCIFVCLFTDADGCYKTLINAF